MVDGHAVLGILVAEQAVLEGAAQVLTPRVTLVDNLVISSRAISARMASMRRAVGSSVSTPSVTETMRPPAFSMVSSMEPASAMPLRVARSNAQTMRVW